MCCWLSWWVVVNTTEGMCWLLNGPLARYVKLRVAHAPGMPGTFSPPRRVCDPDMHHGTCVTHVLWCMPGSLTSGFLWSWWRGKRSRHSRRMRNRQYYVPGKRPMAACFLADLTHNTSAVVCTTTNQDSQQHMIGQFLFYHEYKAINSDELSSPQGSNYCVVTKIQHWFWKLIGTKQVTEPFSEWCSSLLTHIWAFAGSGYGFSPGWCQVITWTNSGLSSVGDLKTNSSKFWIKLMIFFEEISFDHVVCEAVTTVECRYNGNAVRHTILHSAIQWQQQNWNQISNSQQTPIPRPHGRAMGCLFWGFWRKLIAL